MANLKQTTKGTISKAEMEARAEIQGLMKELALRKTLNNAFIIIQQTKRLTSNEKHLVVSIMDLAYQVV